MTRTFRLHTPRRRATGGALLFLLLCLARTGHAQETTAAPLTLAGAQAEALAANPAAQAAEQQFTQAEARLAQARAGRRFGVTFNSTVSGSDARVLQPPPAHETFGTLQNTLTVPLPFGKRPGLAVSQAQELLAAARFGRASARYALTAQVTAAYFDGLRQAALQTVAQETLAQARRELSDTDKRFRAGDAAQLDVLQAQVPVANAEAALAQAGNAAALARQTLNDLLNRPLDAPLRLADVPTLPPAPALTLDGARTLALRGSPDVQAADAAVRAAEWAMQNAKLYREPQFSVQAIDTRSTDQTSFSREDTVQAQVSLPLSDGGLGQAQTREAEAALRAARAQAQSARKAVLLTVSGAFLNAVSSRAQVTAAQAAQDIAQITVDKTVRGYQNGLLPLLNVLNAQNALAQARIALVQARYGAAAAAEGLRASVQGFSVGAAAPPVPSPALAPPTGNTTPPGTNANGTSPAGAGTPGTTPAGTSTTGPATTGTATP